ncbi:hypothetical protein H6801_03280 [Candidatus Nomurabacteria bacterium]|jgi:hypothetical protein|nr:hypothetical protein [Candidatus Nomurabacteria bacterium]
MAQTTTFMMSRNDTNLLWKRNHNITRHSIGSKSFGPVAHTVIVIMLLSIMGLMYLAQINKTNAFTYPINELEAKKTSLISEQQQLKVEAARLGSLDTVKNSTVAQNMVSPADVKTIR